MSTSSSTAAGAGTRSPSVHQDGTWLEGSHQGDFTARDLAGTIEGDKVTLRSVDQRPGDSITFIFAGTLASGTISGPIHLGEYLTARFTARRHAYHDDAHAHPRCRAGRRWRREGGRRPV